MSRTMRNTIRIGLACVFALASSLAFAKGAPPKSNGLALTPPMGWVSWNNFGDDINEAIILETIDAMVSNGLRDAGYVYVNLDDGWQRYKGKRAEHPLEYVAPAPEMIDSGVGMAIDVAHPLLFCGARIG